MPLSQENASNIIGLRTTAYMDGSINVSFSVVAVNNAGERSETAFEQHVTGVISE